MTPLYAAVDMNTFPDTPGRPTPKPSGTLDAVGIVKALLEHRREPERDPERTDPRARARSRRRDARRRRDAAHARGEEGRRRDDAAAAGAWRRPEVEDEGGDRGADVRIRLRRSGTLHRLRGQAGNRGRFHRRCGDCASSAAPTSTPSTRTVRRHCIWRSRSGPRPSSDSSIERGARVDVKDKQGRTPHRRRIGRRRARARGGHPGSRERGRAAACRDESHGTQLNTSLSRKRRCMS